MKKFAIKPVLIYSVIAIAAIFAIVYGCNASKKAAETIRDIKPDFAIPLQNRTIITKPGISKDFEDALVKGDKTQYVFLQFKKPLGPEEHRQLSEAGIELESYLGGNAYWAILSGGLPGKESPIRKSIRWGSFPDVGDKLSRSFLENAKNEMTLDSVSGKFSYLIEFFPGASPDQIKSTLAQFGYEGEPYGSPVQWRILTNDDRVSNLAGADIVKYIEPGPVRFLPLNNGGTRVTRTNEAQQLVFGDVSGNPAPAFIKASGANIRIGICDSGVDENHRDFFTIIAGGAPGVTRVYSIAPGGDGHGTHVASIAAGNGINSMANGFPAFHYMGHAPEALIGDYPMFSSDANRYYNAIVNDQTNVTNHSYVQTFQPEYDLTAANLDRIIRGNGQNALGQPIPPRPQVWAAGNNGVVSQYGDEEGFYSVFTSAKNSISVGSTDTKLSRISRFSSLGPTFDGRIKPDIVAPGCENSIASPNNGIDAASVNTQGYAQSCGTSMAAPAVAGIIGLMMDQYQRTFGGGVTNLPPSLFKAILVQTAQDMEKTSNFSDNEFNNPDMSAPLRYHAGPDFSTGYGLVDAEAARELMITTNRQRLGNIGATGQTLTYCVRIPAGTKEFKVTLAWDDLPGAANTSMTANKLVNDLDLVLVAPNGTLHYPWTLDPLPLTASPGAGGLDPITQNDIKPAYKAPDHRNNVEMGQVCNPQPGVWRVRVRGFNLPMATGQRFSLVSSRPFDSFCISSICEIFPWICNSHFFPRFPVQPVGRGFFRITPSVPIPIEEICRFVIDCPGCEVPSWKLCPGYDVIFSKIPDGIKIALMNQEGRILQEQSAKGGELKLSVRDYSLGDQLFLIFSDSEERELKEAFETGIQIK